jgi:hypothetical protein
MSQRSVPCTSIQSPYSSPNKRTKGAWNRTPFAFPLRAARDGFDAAASCLIAPDIMRARTASLAPLTSPSPCFASAVSAAARAVPLCARCADMDRQLAQVFPANRDVQLVVWL